MPERSPRVQAVQGASLAGAVAARARRNLPTTAPYQRSMARVRQRCGRARPHHIVAALMAAWLTLATGSFAQGKEATVVNNSELDAALFYQLLLGELELRKGMPTEAFELLLDAARKTKDARLFHRATTIARQARLAEQALTASQTWSEAFPDSLEAHRYYAQSLLELGRIPELAEPLRSMIRLAPPANRAMLIASLPRLLTRTSDLNAAASMLDSTLAPYLKQPETAIATRVALGRMWMAASDRKRALDLAQQAHALDPSAEGPALLALELLPWVSSAEPIVASYLATEPAGSAIRLIYARILTTTQRYTEAIEQFEGVTRNDPTTAAAWLSLGALHLELRQAQQAMDALQKYVQLVQAHAAATEAPGEAEHDAPLEADAASPGLHQTYMMLAQAAELLNDYSAAEAWLAKVDSPQRALEVQLRRASILARQGKLPEALELLRSTPETSTGDERAKLLAEVQILRDAKLWAEANTLLAAANQKFPDDVDLLYEQSMVVDKLGQPDEMERLLRRVIEINNKHHHAYNALGYSLADRNQRLPEARTLIRKALELKPGDPFITDSLGWVEYRLGHVEEATRLLRQAYRSRPDVEIAAHLGEVLWVSGQRNEARLILRDARSREPSNDVLRETMARLQVDL